MKDVIIPGTFPASSIILKGFDKYEYADCYQIIIPLNDSVDTLTTKIFNTPGWADYLMRLRDMAVSVFGLKTSGKIKPNISTFYPVGSRAGLFTVINRNDNEIIMAEDDKHLNFRVSTLTQKDGNNYSVYVTTIVKYNNFLGRLYFFFVKPFHRMIVMSALKKVQEGYYN